MPVSNTPKAPESGSATSLKHVLGMVADLLTVSHAELSVDDGTRLSSRPDPWLGIDVLEAEVQAASGLVVCDLQAQPAGSKAMRSGRAHGFYAGVPLRLASGQAMGVLSIVDPHPRSLNDLDRTRLTSFAALIAADLERNGGFGIHPVIDSRQSQTDLLEATLATMDQGIAHIDRHGYVLVANARLAELLGLPREFLTGRPHVHEVRALQEQAGEYSTTSAEFQRWIRAGELIPSERTYERTRPNGVVLEVRSVPLPDGGVVRTYSDITARRKAEYALRESEALYRLLAENSTDMIVRTNLAGF